MKILLVVDGSPYPDMATRMLKALRLSHPNDITVLTVIPEHTFLGGITLGRLKGNGKIKEAQQQKALELLRGPVQTLIARHDNAVPIL